MDVTQRTRSISPTQATVEANLVSDHLPLVHHVVHGLLGRLPQHLSRDGLISAGMLGLAQAARSYDPTHGVPFARHATNRIRGALLDELRAIDWASRGVRADARRLASADETLTTRLGRTPTPGELAAELGVARAEVDKLVNDVHRATVLNYESIIADGHAEAVLLAADEATPEQVLLGREQQAYLRDAIAALPERLRTVVQGCFYDERPMQQLAEELGLSESRIGQLRADALILLRDGLNTHLDPDKLEAERRPDGRAAKRKAAYYADIATRSDYHTRLTTPAANPVLATVGA
jgi:RNA polymerase sigma factor for flagellar operon FliA